MLIALVLVILASASWLAFTLGRVTADRRPNLNHHKMMMLLMDLQHRDSTVPIMPAPQRSKLNRLLTEYERLDLDE